ncbi:SMP-LTD domain-containing protein [Plasmodiophora brassicae]
MTLRRSVTLPCPGLVTIHVDSKPRNAVDVDLLCEGASCRRLYLQLGVHVLLGVAWVFAVCLTLFIISLTWAVLFLEPIAQPHRPLMPASQMTDQQQLQALSASAEFGQSILQTALYDWKSGDEVQTVINGMLSKYGVPRSRVHTFEIKPKSMGPTQINTVAPFVLNLVGHKDDSFEFDGEVNVPFAKADVEVLGLRGSFKNVGSKSRVTLVIPKDIHDVGVQFKSIDALAFDGQHRSRMQRSFMNLLGRMYPGTVKPIARLPALESKLRLLEMVNQVSEDDRYQRVKFVAATHLNNDQHQGEDVIRQRIRADQERAFKHVPKGYARGADGTMHVPEAFKSLSREQRETSLASWTALYQKFMYTFALDDNSMHMVRKTIVAICQEEFLGVKPVLRSLDLGIRSSEDVLAVRLLPFQDPRPFTYKTWFDWEIPNFCMRLGLDGFNGGSYMEFEVSNIAMRGPATVQTIHPLLMHRSYATLQFDAVPAITFDFRLDHDSLHLFHSRLPANFFGVNVRATVLDTFTTLLARPLVAKMLSLVFTSCTYPNTLSVPWITDPSKLLFSSDDHQKIYRALRVKLWRVQTRQLNVTIDGTAY